LIVPWIDPKNSVQLSNYTQFFKTIYTNCYYQIMYHQHFHFFLSFILPFPFPCTQAKSSNWMMRNHFNLISDMTEGQKYYFTCNKKFLILPFPPLILHTCCKHYDIDWLLFSSSAVCYDTFLVLVVIVLVPFLLDMMSASWLSKSTLKYT